MDRESKITYIFVTAVNPLKESAVTWLKLFWDKILQKNVVIGLKSVVGSGNCTFCKKRGLRKWKTPKNQDLYLYSILKTEKRKSFFNFQSPLWKLEKSAPLSNQWSVPAILLFTKNADYENEKCLKIKVFICILHSKQQKDTLFLTSTRRYENLRKVPPFLIKSGTFLGFVFDINWSNFLE